MAYIKKGDTIKVLSGKDQGKTGKVLQVWPRKERALVEGLNLAKHFDRRTQENPQGGVIERERPIAVGKIALVCAKCHRPVRIRWKSSGEDGKQRICARCGEAL